MEKLILYIKTYRPDFERVKILINSIEKHNKDHIPVLISVNDEDYDFFRKQFNTYKVIKDSEIVVPTITDPWRYQQIIKAHLYKLNICKNYLCIDSDSEFIRNFYYDDFLYDDDTPYTIMHESKSFLEAMNQIGLDSENIFFKNALRATRPLFGNKGKEWDYGPSPYLWSCRVWQHLVEVYLKGKNQDFEDFFNKIDYVTPPSECVIYGEYLLKTKLLDIYPIDGLFKVYHYEKQFKLEKKNYNKDQLKKVYLGIVLQSNWKSSNIKLTFWERVKDVFS